MAKKFNLSKNKSFNNKSIIQDNLNTIIINPTYESKIDYTLLEVAGEEKIQLIQCEQIISEKQKNISISLMEMSTALYNAQQILSNRENGDGTFTKWFTGLGLDKSFVYRCLDKYNLYLISNMETVMNLTVKETSLISRALKENKIEEAEVIEIINSNNIIKAIESKTEEPKQKIVVDITEFITLDKKEQKKELKNIKISRKSKVEELARKKDDLKELKEEIENLKNEIEKIKEIEKKMKNEISK